MTEIEDRRIQKTEKALLESLESLILEKGYDEINIQDITDRANLGRATFYLRHKEKDDLLDDLLHKMGEDFLSSFSEIIPHDWNLGDLSFLQRIFAYFQEHYAIFHALMDSKGGFTTLFNLQTELKGIIETSLSNEMQTKNLESTLPPEFITNYYAGALVGLIFWWLYADMPFTPTEMTQMYRNITLNGRKGLLKPTFGTK